MNIFNWLYLKFNGICTTHLIQRDAYVCEGGGGWSDCPKCAAESTARHQAQIASAIAKARGAQ